MSFAISVSRRSWSDSDWARIASGFVPKVMEDHWFLFVENYRLFAHRSWTGLGVFEAQFSPIGERWSISEALVADEFPTWYHWVDDVAGYASLLLEELIELLLLENNVESGLHRFEKVPERPSRPSFTDGWCTICGHDESFRSEWCGNNPPGSH